MSIYSKVTTGTKRYRSLIPSFDRLTGTINFFRLYPVQSKFLVPGDIWREQVNLFIRLQPMLAPVLTPNHAKVRHWVVPLRLVEPELAELIITGSKDGVVDEDILPTFPSVFEDIEAQGSKFSVHQDSILHVMFGIPVATGSPDAPLFDNTIKNDKSLPRQYWLKGFCRLWWDYYRDENNPLTLETIQGDAVFVVGDLFDPFCEFVCTYANRMRCLPICLPKDYFTSTLAWQLKGATPTIRMEVDSSLHWKGISDSNLPNSQTVAGFYAGQDSQFREAHSGLATVTENGGLGININESINEFLANIDIDSNELQFDVSKLRDIFAQTRVMERLARCGSRYTEYLKANFGISPSDGTLQRAIYLGGFKQEILTTEVLQTAPGSTPVGTMRGHGISNQNNRSIPYVSKEFNLFYTTVEVEPEVSYTQGLNREWTYGERWEFFNPSFQNLSEQEVRNGEIYYSNDGQNDDTFGFQGMYNEMRSGKARFFGEMLDSLAYWNQAVHYSERPLLNGAFLNGTNYAADWLRPFGLASESSTNPIIIDFYSKNIPFRPMIKNPTPGLIDHN